MGFETRDIVQGERKIVVTQLDSFDALDLLAKLGDILAPSLVLMIAREQFVGDVLVDGETLADATSAAISKIKNRAERELLIHQIFAKTEVIVDGRKVEPTNKAAIAQAFGPDLLAMFQALGFVLHVQFGPFLPVVFAFIRQRLAAAAKAASDSSSTVTPNSAASG